VIIGTPLATDFVDCEAVALCPSLAAAKRLAEGLWHGDIRRGSASVHHLSDIAAAAK